MKARSKWAKQIDQRNKNIARALLFLNSILWLVYTIYIYFDMAVINRNEFSADIVTIYVLINAILMFICGIVLGREKPPSFYFCLIVVIPNIILTAWNLSDLLFLTAFILDILVLWLLISLRRLYFSNP